MQAVILAAGKGTRLGSFTEESPKSLVPVPGGGTYLDLQLRSLGRFDLSSKIVVTGFAATKMRDFFATREWAGVELVHNADFEKGNLYSLLAAKRRLSENFFIFNADHFYAPSLYQKIFSLTAQHITIFCDRDRPLGDDDMKAAIFEENGKKRLTMAKTLKDFHWGYVGVTCVPASQQDLYWRACDVVAREWGDKAHVEHVIKYLGEQGERVDIVDLSGAWWTEIDTPEDYLRAQRMIEDHWVELVDGMGELDGSRV